MRGREFTGRTTAEILDEIASKLGPDALILGAGTASAPGSAKAFGITACRGEEAPRETAARRGPSGIRRVITGLSRIGVPERLHGALVEQVLSRLAPEALLDAEAVEGAFLDLVAARFSEPAPTEPVPGRVRRAAFVGPSGSGKTTALLKLAGNLAGRTPLLAIGAFECAAGGAERLGALAGALGVPAAPVAKPKEFRALGGRAREAVLLLDTGGVGASRPAEIARTKTFLCDAGVTDTHLVLPAGLDPEEARELAAEMAGAPGLRILLAKVDEAAHPARLLGFALEAGLRLSYVGSGAGAIDALATAGAAVVRGLAARSGAPRTGRPAPAGAGIGA